MKLTRDNFGDLLTPIHKKVFFNAYGEVSEQYSKIFQVEEMTKKQETFPHLGAFGLWDSNTEGNTINEDSITQGNEATFTAVRYDKGYELTWELVQDDLYRVMKGIGKGGSAMALGNGLRKTIETQCAAVLSGGFTNTGYDGAALFSNSHPLADSSSYGDNLTTGALTDANLKLGLTLMRNTVDEANVKIQAVAKNLIVAPDNEWTALQILKSVNEAGELSNNMNVLPRLNLIVLDFLPSTAAAYWFLQDPSIENLKFMWREKPMFDSEKIPKTVDYFCYGYARFDEGYADYRGLVGSTG